MEAERIEGRPPPASPRGGWRRPISSGGPAALAALVTMERKTLLRSRKFRYCSGRVEGSAPAFLGRPSRPVEAFGQPLGPLRAYARLDQWASVECMYRHPREQVEQPATYCHMRKRTDTPAQRELRNDTNSLGEFATSTAESITRERRACLFASICQKSLGLSDIPAGY